MNQNEIDHVDTVVEPITFISPASQLLQRRAELRKADERLQEKKSCYRKLQKDYEVREGNMRLKDLLFQENLVKFHTFLQENESKRNRAVKRMMDERKIREQKVEEATKLHELYQKKVADHQELKLQFQKYQQFREYLNEVLEASSGDFLEIQDLIKRHKILKEANKELKTTKESNDCQHELLHEKYICFVRAGNNNILDNKNKVNELQKDFEEQNRNSSLFQADIDVQVQNMSNKALELNQVYCSIVNILERCEKGSLISRVPMKHVNSIKKKAEAYSDLSAAVVQLDEISLYISDYSNIVQELSQKCL